MKLIVNAVFDKAKKKALAIEDWSNFNSLEQVHNVLQDCLSVSCNETFAEAFDLLQLILSEWKRLEEGDENEHKTTDGKTQD